jgi:isopentenyl diphosphate isomerase/L-lactate dehydrogenase-like FMN-dependent dehydrogenase
LLDQAVDGFNLDLVHAKSDERPRSELDTKTALLEWISQPPMWEDLLWIKQEFKGPVVVKGVLSVDDALRAVDHGASAVIVSNHGGRQLDGAEGTLTVLPEIVKALGNSEVYVDGGIRSGADVIRALSLGARAAMVGRAWAYGLCAAGYPGVLRVLELLREDIDRTMRLLGVASVDDLKTLRN